MYDPICEFLHISLRIFWVHTLSKYWDNIKKKKSKGLAPYKFLRYLELVCSLQVLNQILSNWKISYSCAQHKTPPCLLRVLPLLSWRRPGTWRRTGHRLCCRPAPGYGISLSVYLSSIIYLSIYSLSIFIYHCSSSHGSYLNIFCQKIHHQYCYPTPGYGISIYPYSLTYLSIFSLSIFIYHCSSSHGSYLDLEKSSTLSSRAWILNILIYLSISSLKSIYLSTYSLSIFIYHSSSSQGSYMESDTPCVLPCNI